MTTGAHASFGGDAIVWTSGSATIHGQVFVDGNLTVQAEGYVDLSDQLGAGEDV